MNSNDYKNLLEEYFRRIPHPKELEIRRKFPNIWDNKNIRMKLLKRYPPTRRTDQEYREFWDQAMAGPSIFERIKEKK